MRAKYTLRNGSQIDIRYDDDQWITTENGHHTLIGENGEIKAGFGGKFNGEKINEIADTSSEKTINKKQKYEMKENFAKHNMPYIKQVMEQAKDGSTLKFKAMVASKGLFGKRTLKEITVTKQNGKWIGNAPLYENFTPAMCSNIKEMTDIDYKGKFEAKVNKPKESSPTQAKEHQTKPSDVQQQKTVSESKQKQFEIIQKSNPMLDDYHTGIRNANEILSAEEVFGVDENNFTGAKDWTYADSQKALKNGNVTVYSSYPIKDGVFVSPSRQIAQDYAGKGKVYSKTISIENVAWIDSSEGQFAKWK